jgi:hypothetical protein
MTGLDPSFGVGMGHNGFSNCLSRVASSRRVNYIVAMPRRDELPVAIRFTDEQKAWLVEEGERLDRPIAWIVRKLVEAAMIKETAPTTTNRMTTKRLR